MITSGNADDERPTDDQWTVQKTNNRMISPHHASPHRIHRTIDTDDNVQR